MRLRTRAEIDQEPRIAQFRVTGHCPDDGEPDAGHVATWHRKHPGGVVVEVYLYPAQPTIYNACEGLHWKLTRESARAHAPSRINAHPSPDQEVQVYVCEHMGELIPD